MFATFHGQFDKVAQPQGLVGGGVQGAVEKLEHLVVGLAEDLGMFGVSGHAFEAIDKNLYHRTNVGIGMQLLDTVLSPLCHRVGG